jgi:hypothetical protein
MGQEQPPATQNDTTDFNRRDAVNVGEDLPIAA